MSNKRTLGLYFRPDKDEFVEPFAKAAKKAHPEAVVGLIDPEEGQIPQRITVCLEFIIEGYATFDEAFDYARGFMDEVYKNITTENPELSADYDVADFEISGEELPPEHPLTIEAYDLINDGKFQEAINKVEPLLKSDEIQEKADAYFLTAHCYFQMQDFTKSISCYQSLIDLDQDLRSNYISIGICQANLGNFDQAKASVEKAISTVDTTSMQMLCTFTYAQILQELEQFDLAQQEFNRIINVFKEIKSTDPTLLAVKFQGLGPQLIEILEGALPMLKHLPKEDAITWLDDIHAHTDEDGQEMVQEIKDQL